jgi:CrcB protein
MSAERPILAEIAATYARVALGSAAGGLARWLAPMAMAGASEMTSTLVINTTGSFAIGALAGLAARGRLNERWREGLMTGFCGGYTTFSAFSLYTLDAWNDGDTPRAATYVGLSLVGWLASVWLGYTCTAPRITAPRA